MRCCRRDQLAKLSVHVEIASELNRQIDDRRLTDLGKLEQASSPSVNLLFFTSRRQHNQ